MNDDSSAVPHRTAPHPQKHRVIEQIKQLTLIENQKQTESRKNMVHRTNSDLLVCSTLIIRIFSSVRAIWVYEHEHEHDIGLARTFLWSWDRFIQVKSIFDCERPLASARFARKGPILPLKSHRNWVRRESN